MYINYYLRQEKNPLMIFLLASQFDYLYFSIFSLMFLAEKKQQQILTKQVARYPHMNFLCEPNLPSVQANPSNSIW